MTSWTAWSRRPFVAAAIVATIALGIGAATAVYAVVEAVILRALPVREPERLVWMWNAASSAIARRSRRWISPTVANRTACSTGSPRSSTGPRI